MAFSFKPTVMANDCRPAGIIRQECARNLRMIKCARCIDERPYSSVDRALPSGGRSLRSNRSRGIAQHKTPSGRFMLGFREFLLGFAE